MLEIQDESWESTVINIKAEVAGGGGFQKECQISETSSKMKTEEVTGDFCQNSQWNTGSGI